MRHPPSRWARYSPTSPRASSPKAQTSTVTVTAADRCGTTGRGWRVSPTTPSFWCPLRGGWRRLGLWGGLLFQQRRSAVRSMRDGVVAVVGGWVEGHDVRAVGEMSAGDQGRASAGAVQDAEGAVLGGDVEPVRARVVGQYVGGITHRQGRGDLPGGQVDCGQGGVALA